VAPQSLDGNTQQFDSRKNYKIDSGNTNIPSGTTPAELSPPSIAPMLLRIRAGRHYPLLR
jgi:hypothetical protein